jgi:RNA polymerase sigma-70 factor (ECF subfamily)
MNRVFTFRPVLLPYKGVVEDALVEARPHGVLEDVYREHGNRLWRAVLAFTGDPEMASDAVAEAFAQALRRGSAIHSPLAWIWRAAFRIAAGSLKERTHSAHSAAEGRYEPAEPAGELLAALRRLSPKQRAAVVLHHYAGYPVRDVAAILGSTGPAVRVHLSRGRKRLRELLETTDA